MLQLCFRLKTAEKRERNTPCGCIKGRAKWEHQDFSLLLSLFRSFSFRSLLSQGLYKRSRIELQYVRLHTSYLVLKPRYFSPTYKRQVICTFSTALHVPNDFSSRHTFTNTHKACAFMHKQSWSSASAPLQCYLTGFSYQPALYQIKSHFR